MALVVFTDGRNIKVTKEQGHNIWYILNGEIEAQPEQEKFIEKIEKIYLNYANAPDSYIKQNMDSYIRYCKNEWPVDYDGKPSRPYGTKQWNIAKKWGFAPTTSIAK